VTRKHGEKERLGDEGIGRWGDVITANDRMRNLKG